MFRYCFLLIRFMEQNAEDEIANKLEADMREG